MKHISKKLLLFGAFAMLIQGIPVQAMEGAPAGVQEEVAVKQSFFARWTDKAKSMRLEALMKELNSHWKKFMKCVKADEGCPRSLVWTIRGILATIIALVAVQAVKAGAGFTYAALKIKEKEHPERLKVSEFYEHPEIAKAITEAIEEEYPKVKTATEKFKRWTKTEPKKD